MESSQPDTSRVLEAIEGAIAAIVRFIEPDEDMDGAILSFENNYSKLCH